jgi:DNA repair exonuclease SbcCD ATPase subunit
VEKLPDQIEKAIEDLQSASKSNKAKAIWTIFCIVGALIVGFSFAYLTIQDSIEAGVTARHSAEMKNRESEISLLRTQIENYIDDKDNLQKQLKEATEQDRDLEALQRALSTSEERLEALEIQLQSLLSERSTLLEQLTSREAKINEITAEVDKWRKASEEAETKIVALQRELKSVSDTANGPVIDQETNTEPNEIAVPAKPEQPLDEIETRCAANGEFVEVVEDVPLRTCSGDYVVLADRVTSSAYISVNGAERSRIAPGSSHDYFGGKCKVSVTGLNRGTNNTVTLYVNCS